VRALVEGAAAEHGGLDVVVSNTGICSLSPITAMPYGLWRDLMSSAGSSVRVPPRCACTRSRGWTTLR
jgi:NAD(P)-dependent dehydrogenase (short-subunit alcohol dehydrogenase family)